MGIVADRRAKEPTLEPGAMEQLEALYRAEYQPMVSLALLLTGSAGPAEELAQDAFVRVAPKLGAADNPGGYLRTTLVNLCRDDGRRQVTAQRHRPPPRRSVQAPAVPTDVGEVWSAIQTLPEPRRQALILRYWADLPTDEIAQLLDVPHPTVRSHIRRGLAALREVLNDDR